MANKSQSAPQFLDSRPHTNGHVMACPEDGNVEFPNKHRIRARLVGRAKGQHDPQ